MSRLWPDPPGLLLLLPCRGRIRPAAASSSLVAAGASAYLRARGSPQTAAARVRGCGRLSSPAKVAARRRQAANFRSCVAQVRADGVEAGPYPLGAETYPARSFSADWRTETSTRRGDVSVAYPRRIGYTTVLTYRGCIANPTIANVKDQTEAEVAMGYTMTEICDQFIEFFMYKKPETKDWRKVLVFREEWQRYKDHFYKRCQVRIDMETDSSLKQKLVVLARKVKKIDDEIEKHMKLFTELQENPADVNAIVARRRKDFTQEFFRHLNVLVNTYNGLDERDGVVRLAAKCLSAIHAYDYTLEQLDIESAQSKFDDILNSSSLDDACDKIKSLAKAKELDSSLILLINRAWAAAKDSTTMKDKVKDIMYNIYTTAKESLKSISPPEMKLLKYLLNIEDPEERFGALATAFSPGDEREAKDEDALYTTPNELHKWIKTMLDSYHLNKEETDFMDARKMSDPVIIQRLTLLKETIEEEYMKHYVHPEEQESMDDEEADD